MQRLTVTLCFLLVLVFCDWASEPQEVVDETELMAELSEKIREELQVSGGAATESVPEEVLTAQLRGEVDDGVGGSASGSGSAPDAAGAEDDLVDDGWCCQFTEIRELMTHN